jgi:hypothetical protein
MLKNKFSKKNTLYFIKIFIVLLILVFFGILVLKFFKKYVSEGFDIMACTSINAVAEQPTSKTMITNEIITSMNNHAKFFKIYGALDCDPYTFNKDGTVVKNDNACDNPCLVTGTSCARHKCKYSKCIEWNNYITGHELGNWKDKPADYVQPLSSKEYTSVNNITETIKAAANTRPPYTHKTCTGYENRICEVYTKECDFYQTDYKCEPLKNYKITTRDLAQMSNSGYSMYKFAANIIPYLASHDLMIKKLDPSFSFYDLGTFDTSTLMPEDPTAVNYNKMMSKMHNGLFYYNVGNCAGSGVDDSVSDNDGYILWILVDWVRYQDHHIKNFTDSNTADSPLINK